MLGASNPLTERREYAGVLPDKIAIHRLPLEEEFGDDPAVLQEEIRVTVLHEIAHHFGIDEDRLDQLGWSQSLRAPGGLRRASPQSA